MDTFADRIIAFNKGLDFHGTLPEGIRMMNPYKENVEALACSTAFYRKYYDDHDQRYLILGINPGRFGSGATGVSFTDPKRLVAACGIPFSGPMTHEPSSEFIYNMIDAYGGVKEFYHRFYIHSICPLGFTIEGKNGKEINYNYYDRPDLLKAVYSFIIENLEKQLAMGFQRDICFCLGTGKNEQFLRKLNQEMKFFNKIVALEHPRYIMQYKSKEKLLYLDKYLEAFKQVS
jgi:hypothetical protein